MRTIPPAMLEALAGSTPDARLSCEALYGGAVAAAELDVSSWSMSWRLGDQQMVQGSASFTVQDPDGLLAPWSFDEPLSVGGSRIRTLFECGGESLPMGEWVISRNQPNEVWRIVGPNLTWVHGGATVPLDGADLTQLLADDRFMSPEGPGGGATAFSEIERLCDGIIGVVFSGVTDKSVPLNTVYHEERVNAVADLVKMIGGEYRVNGDGLLEVFNPARPALPMWEITPGEEGALVAVGREQSRDNLYNAVVSTGQTDAGDELRAYATLTSGPLRFDGPFGRKPMFHTAQAQTQSGVQADADTTLRNRVEASTTILEVHCAPSPLYEIGDWGVVAQPVVDGTVYPLVGRCVEVALSGGSDGFAAMKLSMECATSDVLEVARYVRRSML